jgi:hypothetical protein
MMRLALSRLAGRANFGAVNEGDVAIADAGVVVDRVCSWGHGQIKHDLHLVGRRAEASRH